MPPHTRQRVALMPTASAAAAPDPAFEVVVLGSGGGPLETDCSGYLVKPACNRWEDGVLSMEGGSGIGALVALLQAHPASTLFPSISFPEAYNTPVLQAAYVFSYLSCYLITHAHLDHAVSLIMLSGSVPPRPRDTHVETCSASSVNEVYVPSRIPVYARRETLDQLATVYGGGLWPELGAWAAENGTGRRKRKRVDGECPGVGPIFSPLFPARSYSQLHHTLPIVTRVFPVSHGRTSQGTYPSSAVFVRYHPSILASRPVSRSASQSKLSTPPDEDSVMGDESFEAGSGREFLFFGDVESAWRAPGEEEIDKDGAEQAAAHNCGIWEHAAKVWKDGQLSAVFIECSYDSSRPAMTMYGHLSPPGIFHELKTLAAFLEDRESLPLAGLRIFITHIKEFLVPHPTGRTARQLIQSELESLEQQHQLGVEFHLVAPGDRLCESAGRQLVQRSENHRELY